MIRSPGTTPSMGLWRWPEWSFSCRAASLHRNRTTGRIAIAVFAAGMAGYAGLSPYLPYRLVSFLVVVSAVIAGAAADVVLSDSEPRDRQEALHVPDDQWPLLPETWNARIVTTSPAVSS